MKFLEKPINWLAAVPLLVLVGIANYAVVMRYAVGQPVHWSEEVSGLLMIWIVMFGAIAAERDGQHLTISLLTDAMPKRARLLVNAIVASASVAVILYVGWIGLQLALSVQFKVTSILRISWLWIDIAIPVGAVGIALYMLIDAIKGFRALAEDDAE
ncbi:TRAP transporter small permease [Devosia sp. A449]